MAAVLTITLGPSVDTWTTTPRLVPEAKLRCTPPLHQPGGGGINVARVLHRLGTDVLALHVASGPTGTALAALLDHEQLPVLAVAGAGDTRRAWAVAETDTGREYRFVPPAPALPPSAIEAITAHVATVQPAPRYVVLSGSLPTDCETDFHARLAHSARSRGCIVALDGSGPALAAALESGVDVVKPSLHEMRELTGAQLDTLQERVAACRSLVASGRAGMVALTLGSQGAVLVTNEVALHAPALQVRAAGTVGAGDSFLAGLVHEMANGRGMHEALRTATAAGAATVLHNGTSLCDAGDVERLRPQVQVQSL
ncbi:1-phosphofructokinase family hexose kinase [Ramlibacter sp. MMS24-I3-19]|uniref:1-phosphofructokinase family hexose kinase n=1 Tax=Ramlibacter sp. MMS24-I3-19 TaxID=3416606 RepID=UPI003D058DE0